ncbi:MAG: alpha/beta fold hydrolase [Dehalococcoidia bacterium]
MPHIDRDGVSVYYAAHGQGSPVLLSHGYGATSAMWEGQLGPLGGAHRIVTWDMRGHGETDSPDDQDAYTEDTAVEDMAAVLDAEGIDQAVVGGLSLGGYMSLGFYLKYPERVSALMLFDTGPGYNNPNAREEWNKTAVERAETFEQQGLDALGRGAEVQVSHHRSADGLAKAARGMLAQFDARVIQSLDSIAVPTLVLVGAKDRAFLAATDYMEAKIPNAQKVVIDDAGHAANIHQPEAFNQAVGEFLGGL